MFFSLQTSTHCYCTFQREKRFFYKNSKTTWSLSSSTRLDISYITWVTLGKCRYRYCWEGISQHPSFKLHQTCIWFSDIIIFNLFFTFKGWKWRKGRYLLLVFLRWFMLMFGTIYICSKFYTFNFAWSQKRPFGNVRRSKLNLKDLIGALGWSK